MRNFRKKTRKQLRHLYENIFVGRHSTTIVVGFTVGGSIMGRSLWQYLYASVGLFNTLLVGFLIFILSGMYMHKFYNIPDNEIIEE